MANMFDWLMISNLARAQAPMSSEQEQPPMAPQVMMSEMPESQKQAFKQKMEEEKLKAQFPTFARNMQPQSMSFSLPMRDPQAEALAAQLREQYGKKIGQVDIEQDRLRQYIEGVGKLPTKLDFTPTAALADKWTGGGNQLTSAAQGMSGLSQEEKAKLLATLQDKVVGNEQALLNSIGQRLNLADSNKAQFRMAELMAKENRQNKGLAQTLGLKFNQDTRQDIKQYYEILPSLGAVEDAIRPDANGRINAQRVKMALSHAARLMGEKGVLTDQDILRVQARTLQAMLADIENFATGPEGTIPASFLKPLQDAIASGRAATTQAATEKLQATRDVYIGLGLDPDFANNTVNTIYGEKFLKNKPGEQKAEPQESEDEKWLKQYRASKGGK